MFVKKRRSRGTYLFVAILVAILLGSNGIGYFLAGNPPEILPEPVGLPQEGPLPFGRDFRVILPTFAVTVPFEIDGFQLTGAYPEELTLRYEDKASGASMTAAISDSRYYFEDRRPIRFPESFLARKGMTGQLIHEIFARGPGSDGISPNPYKAVREGLAARLRRDLNSAGRPAPLRFVFVNGTNRQGQVWRIYQGTDENVLLLEGAIFQPDRIAHLSMAFSGTVPDVLPILSFWSKAVEFVDGDPAINENLADLCLSEEMNEVESSWEAGCRQAHLVASLISMPGGLPMARRLYGEYLTNRDTAGIRSLYDELHYDLHVMDGWDELIGQMEKENPTLTDTEKSDS